MKHKTHICLFVIAGLFYLNTSCNNTPPGSPELWKKEIVDTEKAFSKMVRDSGIAVAFTHFADPEGVLSRGGKIIKGKEEIANFYRRAGSSPGTLEWTPEFIDVSASGDLGYTYGPFEYTLIDSIGNEQVSAGIFHTVWKRQKDGSWRYVWD